MSSQQGRRAVPAFDLSEEAVRGYLESHPDFFERHQPLLDTLRLPHQAGEAVSLVERQLERLRERQQQAERKLKEFIAIARGNEQLADKIHGMVLKLLTVFEGAARLQLIERELREAFGVDEIVLLLFPSARGEPSEIGGFARRVDPGDAANLAYASLLGSERVRCGRIAKSQRGFLFGEHGARVGSLALLPLATRERRLGLLALGSHREEHFHPGSGTELLQRIADSVAAVIDAAP